VTTPCVRLAMQGRPTRDPVDRVQSRTRPLPFCSWIASFGPRNELTVSGSCSSVGPDIDNNERETMAEKGVTAKQLEAYLEVFGEQDDARK
jgi:hypothetical protein